MSLIENRAISIGVMALDGLYERAKAISTNTANALTPGYQRKTVNFEDSLQNVIKRENEKDAIKMQNAAEYQKNPERVLYGQTPEQLSFLNSEMSKEYSINVENDISEPYDVDGNNVSLEEEMMDEAKTGIQYRVVASLLSKSYNQLNQVIRGQ